MVRNRIVRIVASLGLMVALAAVLSACGSASNTASSSTAAATGTAASTSNAVNATTSTKNVTTGGSSTEVGTTEKISMEVLPGELAEKKGILGPGYKGGPRDGHDTFMLAGLTSKQQQSRTVRSTLHVKVGETVEVTVTNHDDMRHSFTSPSLGVNVQMKPGKDVGKKVVPQKTTFTFVAKKPGKYRWYCMDPCDSDNGGWAMTPGADGKPDRLGYMAGYVVVS